MLITITNDLIAIEITNYVFSGLGPGPKGNFMFTLQVHTSCHWKSEQFRTRALMTKKEVRAAARKRFGSNWHACHPVIKKARIHWAEQHVAGSYRVLDPVHVREGGEEYYV